MTLSPSLKAIESSTLISQGAEAKVYKFYATHDTHPILLKHRFQKTYRHPSLDESLTRSRIAGEARALLKCLRAGVNVPGIRMVDATVGLIGIEWVEGQSVRHLLPGAAEDDSDEDVHGANEDKVSDNDGDRLLLRYNITQGALIELIGTEIAKMHLADVIHGDLTTSNMMLREPTTAKSDANSLNAELVLIDFGLSYHSGLVEDKAVDLYVLERAFSSTHPDSEQLFESVLRAYEEGMGKEWRAVGERLQEVRLRGRKRSMVG